jgi:DNA polymerase-3 subunit epsilon
MSLPTSIARGHPATQTPLRTLPPGAPLPVSFVAIDFETADAEPDSACAVGIARVEDGRITDRVYRLIRPPRRLISHTFVHGLGWAQLRTQPMFARIWPQIAPYLEDAGVLVAHNAGFDRSVLEACCGLARVRTPDFPWVCTVELARETWRLPSAKLPAVAAHLGIALQHHHALSDAEACAQILLAARKRRTGADPGTQ